MPGWAAGVKLTWGRGKGPIEAQFMAPICDGPVADSVRFSRCGYAVFAILFRRVRAYLSPRNNTATPGPSSAPRSEVTAMRILGGLIDAGIVATIAFGVFSATANIVTVSWMAL